MDSKKEKRFEKSIALYWTAFFIVFPSQFTAMISVPVALSQIAVGLILMIIAMVIEPKV